MQTTASDDATRSAPPPWWRRLFPLRLGAREPEARELALGFARFLSGQLGARALVAAAAAAPSSAFWAALESFADNIDGEEWERLSKELHGLEEVRRERTRLRHPSPWRRALAARHLGLLNAPGKRGPLLRAMARGPAIVTLSAALALARVRERRALTWLLRHPQATERRSRHQLVALIKRFGPECTPLLRRSLRSRGEETVIRLAAIEVLGLWKDLRSRAMLEAMLEAGPVETRVAAARALGGIGDARATHPLAEALRDAEWQVRAQAARALGVLGSPWAVPRLAAALKDSAWWVRRNAAYALALLGPPGYQALAGVARHTADPFARDMALEVLEALEWERESPGGISRVE